jgi:hypothetical protein
MEKWKETPRAKKGILRRLGKGFSTRKSAVKYTMRFMAL